jgi:hypothetical protein
LLVLNILEDQGVEDKELKRLRQLLQAKDATGEEMGAEKSGEEKK